MKKILVVDDNELFRYSIESMYKNDTEVKYLGTSNITEAKKILDNNVVDLVLLDYELKGEKGTELAKYLKDHNFATKVLFFSIFDLSDKVATLLEIVPAGIIYKDISIDLMKNIINVILAGGKYFDERVIESIEKRERLKSEEKKGNEYYFKNIKYLDEDKNIYLSPKEIEICLKVAEGKSMKEIGIELNKSSRTIEAHKKNIFLKLGFNKSTQLTQYTLTKIIPYLKNI